MSTQPLHLNLHWMRSARAKVLLVLLLLNLAICASVTLSIHQQLRQSLLAQIDSRLQTAAIAIEYILPPSYLEQTLNGQEISHDQYRDNVTKLDLYAKSIGLRYLYVLTLRNNNVIYLADSASADEINRDLYGHLYQPYHDEMGDTRQALQNEQPRIGQLRDAYGDFRSLSMIRKNAAGQVYLLGADISTDAVNFQLWQISLQTLFLGAILLPFGGLISWLLATKLTEPLRRFSHAVQRFTLGEFDLRMPIKSRDELGNLATAFNAMGDALSAREHLLRQLAFEDRTTGLPNRTRFAEILSQHIASNPPAFAVAMMDLADFHYVNDCFGFAEGDNVLRMVADRLSTMQPHPIHTVGRVSGNEFLLLLAPAAPHELPAIIHKIERTLSETLMIDHHKVNLAMRFGVSCYPAHSVDPEALLRQAEIGKYSAKEEYQLCVVYDPSHEVDRQSQFTLMGDLREAILGNQLIVQYQPKTSMRDLKVYAVEALVRWQHPTRGWIAPNLFIAFAEQAGKLRSITEWVIKDVLQQQQKWQSNEINLTVSVNVGVGDVEDSQFVDFIAEQIKDLPTPANLCLEITETGVMRQPELMVQNLSRLRQLNVKLSIDDFGTGYSSFAYLAKMPINELKIDQTFVMAMNSTFESVSIVRSMIELGHILGLKVVAEGVETKACWQALAIMGCDEVQGYLIAKPMAAKDLEAWLKTDLSELNLAPLPNMGSK